jgi:hypothetical protein
MRGGITSHGVKQSIDSIEKYEAYMTSGRKFGKHTEI